MLDGCADIYSLLATRWVLLAQVAGVTVHDGGTSDDTPAWTAAALVISVRYADPFHRRAIDVEAAIDIAVDWHRQGMDNRGITAWVDMSVWKRQRIRQFLSIGHTIPTFSMAAARCSDGSVAAWAACIAPGLAATLVACGACWFGSRMGSSGPRGLGSNFLPPCSVVLDWSGQYVDQAVPSDLERILAETEFSPALLDRARRLIDRLITEGVTKYGRALTVPAVVQGARGQPIVLVPGQVGDDLSVRLAGCRVNNAGLLAAVRAAKPNASIVYKPYPDVIAGHRPGHIDAVPARIADTIVTAQSTCICRPGLVSKRNTASMGKTGRSAARCSRGMMILPV